MERLPWDNDALSADIQRLKGHLTADERAEAEESIKLNRADYDETYADLLDLIDEAEDDPGAYNYAKKNSDAINDHHNAVIDDYNDLKHP